MITTRRGFSVGLAALLTATGLAAFPTGTAQAATACGVERWPVKTGTDADTSKVDRSGAVASTVAAMGALPKPTTLPDANRIVPTETTVYSLSATLTQYKIEDDGDVHLVLSDTTGHTMIAEIPDPTCVGSTSPFLSAITTTRTAFDATYAPTTSWQTVNQQIRLTGVGFFDFLHGQTGVAPNGIELHPVLSLAAAPLITSDRLAGTTRYGTAAAISAATFAPGVSDVYVATGTTYPDALAGAAAAGLKHAPVLLVTATAIPPETGTELTRLHPGAIHVLGGTGVVSDTVLAALGAYAPSVDRLAGPDRFATAATIATTTFTAPVSDVFVATGRDFPDALSGSAAAGRLGVPVLLVDTISVPAATATALTALHPAQITVLGGTGVVSASVATALAAYAPTVRRLAGANRYATSAAISTAVFPTATRALLATGTTFADALAGGPAAAGIPGPVLLSQPTCLPTETGKELTRLGIDAYTLLGGTGALTANVAALSPCAVYVAPTTPPPPPPPTGTLTCKASVSDPTPAQHTTVSVIVSTGLPSSAVAATAHYKTTTTTHTGVSDATATASIPFQLAAATIGYTVIVNVTVTNSGKTATCSTSFTPR